MSQLISYLAIYRLRSIGQTEWWRKLLRRSIWKLVLHELLVVKSANAQCRCDAGMIVAHAIEPTMTIRSSHRCRENRCIRQEQSEPPSAENASSADANKGWLAGYLLFLENNTYQYTERIMRRNRIHKFLGSDQGFAVFVASSWASDKNEPALERKTDSPRTANTEASHRLFSQKPPPAGSVTNNCRKPPLNGWCNYSI
jgi:hypothetical protein